MSRTVDGCSAGSRRGQWRALALALGIVLALVSGCGDEATGSGGLPSVGPGTFARALWRVRETADYTAPAVDDSTVYFVSAHHQIYAVRKSDGSVRWTSPRKGVGFPGASRLLVVGGLVLYPDFQLFAYDVATGRSAWTYRDSVNPDQPLAGIYTLATDSVRVFGGSQNGTLVAVKLATGREAWRVVLAQDPDRAIVWGCVSSNGVVVATYRRMSLPVTGGVAAVDAASGRILWQKELARELPTDQSGGQLDGIDRFMNLVIVSGVDGVIYAFDRDSGSIAWTSPRVPSNTYRLDNRPIAVVGSVIIAGSALDEQMGIDARTGVVLWSRARNQGSPRHQGTPTDSTFLAMYGNGLLQEIVARTGAVIWQTNPASEPWVLTPPAYDAQRVYVACDSGFYALRRR